MPKHWRTPANSSGRAGRERNRLPQQRFDCRGPGVAATAARQAPGRHRPGHISARQFLRAALRRPCRRLRSRIRHIVELDAKISGIEQSMLEFQRSMMFFTLALPSVARNDWQTATIAFATVLCRAALRRSADRAFQLLCGAGSTPAILPVPPPGPRPCASR